MIQFYFAGIVNNSLKGESTPKSDIARHCEERSNPILLIICMLRLLHFVRNDG